MRSQQLRQPAINIGVLTDMSGLFATLAGAASVVAAEMAVQDFGGEVLGKKIRVLFGDHKHKVDVASALATQWFDDEYVGAIFDMPNSSVALAGQKLAAQHGRIAVTVSGGSSDLTGKDCTSTGFHWAYDTYSNTAGIASALVRFGLDTWYFITADYEFGWQLEQDASAAIERSGGRVIGHSRHPLNAKSFLDYLDAAQELRCQGHRAGQCRRRHHQRGQTGGRNRHFSAFADAGAAPGIHLGRSHAWPRRCQGHDKLRAEIAVVIVDHHLDLALALSDRTVVLERGAVSWRGGSNELRDDLALRRKVLWL